MTASPPSRIRRAFSHAVHVGFVKAAIRERVVRRFAWRRIRRGKLWSRQKRTGFGSGSKARVNDFGIAMHAQSCAAAAANGYASDEGSRESARASWSPLAPTTGSMN
jgi:hypothetical protein